MAIWPLASCSKEDASQETSYSVFDELSAEKAFAEILSKAVARDESLRIFIKEEALKKFDNDYDVFYPYTRNNIVSEGKTFEEVLKSYGASSDIITKILSQVPKLTILVQDWSWIDPECFSINNWDTADSIIAVGISDGCEEHAIFYDGHEIDSIKEGEIPDFPVLIIKNNERMRVVSPVTKASEQTFAFVSEAYDGSKASCTTKTHDTLIEWNYNKSGESDFAPASELDPIVINAYNEFGRGLGQQKQRDYIYYGMTNENTNRGVINENIKELVYRFKISPAKINILDYQSSNDQANSDPSFLSTSSVFKGKKNKLNPEDNSIQSYLWSQGSLEINFYFYLGSAGSTALTVYKQPISISPGELWEVKKSIEQRETCGLTFHYHYISSTNDLVAKWYYPNNMVIDSFDLQDKTTQIWFSIYEEDPSGTYSRTFSEYCKYTNNFSLNVQTGKNEKRSFGVNYSDTDERNRTCSAEETINIGSDHLGDAYLEYIYNIIKEETYDENGVHGYNLASVQTAGGQVSVTFVPFNINNL